jgi:hypothetical protein
VTGAVIEITVLRKAGNRPLTKHISLAADGSLKSDGSACVMGNGVASRFEFDHVDQLAKLIEGFGSDQALTLGALRDDLPARVNVVTKRMLNGGAAPDTIARTQEFFVYRASAVAVALIDHDRKGMPSDVANRINQLGGFLPALMSVLPELTTTAQVIRNSTSAGLSRADTGEQMPVSGGVHLYVAVTDGSDIERFLGDLHARCWLVGLGWYVVGVAGHLLERSIVDRVVGTPERLVFEGPPVLDPPLVQDQARRRPVATAGGLLDTMTACPPLSIVEQTWFRALLAKNAERIRPEAEATRKAYVTARARELAAATGITEVVAAQLIESQSHGILLPGVVLPFDDPDLVGSTVGDVLADPDKFVGATLADPIEGVSYGAGKAMIMRRSDRTLWINSFAHGRTVYELQYDEASPKDLAYIERTFPLPRWYRVRLKYDHHGYEVWIHRFVELEHVKDENGNIVKDENGNPVQKEIWASVCTPFSMTAWLKLVDADNAYGLRLLVADRRGQVQQVDFERAELGRQGANAVKARLLAAGMRFAPQQEFLIVDMLKELSPDACLDTVSVTGWQTNDFVTPKGESV